MYKVEHETQNCARKNTRIPFSNVFQTHILLKVNGSSIKYITGNWEREKKLRSDMSVSENGAEPVSGVDRSPHLTERPDSWASRPSAGCRVSHSSLYQPKSAAEPAALLFRPLDAGSSVDPAGVLSASRRARVRPVGWWRLTSIPPFLSRLTNDSFCNWRDVLYGRSAN